MIFSNSDSSDVFSSDSASSDSDDGEDPSQFTLYSRMNKFFNKITNMSISSAFMDFTDIQTKYPEFFVQYPNLLSFKDVGAKLNNFEYKTGDQFLNDLMPTSIAFKKYFKSFNNYSEQFALYCIGKAYYCKFKKMYPLLKMDDNEFFKYKMRKKIKSYKDAIANRPTDFTSHRQIYEQVYSLKLIDDFSQKVEPPPLESVFV